MANELQGKRIAILATDGVEQVELTEPLQAVQAAGATAEVISIKPGQIQAFNHFDKGDMIPVANTVDHVDAQQYDALILPGGVANPDALRVNRDAVSFVHAFFRAGKPVAAICHGPWMLVEANVVKGRTLTSWPSLRTDIENAGGTWVDEEAHVDNGLVTSRRPADLPAFCARLIEEFREGKHLGQMPFGEQPQGSAQPL
jgi:protease I